MRGTVLLRLLAAVFILGLIACGGGSDSTSMSVSISADETAVQRQGYSNITATLSNAQGPVALWNATFRFRQNESGARLDAYDVVTDHEGNVRALYQAGNQPGIDIVEVNFNNSAVAMVQIIVAGGGSPASNVGRIIVQGFGPFEGDPATRVVRATVWDIHGNLLPDAQVNFSSTYGSVDPPNEMTDANGVAETVLTSTQSTSVHATSGGFTATTRVSF
jgi:hypothetical protein